MKSFRSQFKFSIVITSAGLLYLAELAGGANEFRRCYNTTVDTHCFDVQYDNTNSRWLTSSFDNARQRCKNLQATLIIIKDEETNSILQQFMNEATNPIRLQNVWTDAYRVNSFDESYKFSWQWLDTTLPNISATDVAFTADCGWYVAALEFKDKRFRLTGQLPHLQNSYVCEYPVSICSSIISSSVRQFDGRCYTAVNESVNWYDARNRCLRAGGDLASFANISSINFTSWLGSNTNIRYWVGLQFALYIWKDSGEDVKFSKWSFNFNDWLSPCLIVCSDCSSSFAWLPKGCDITDSIYVICHSVTPLVAITTTTVEIPAPAAIATSATTISTANFQQGALIIGLAVGLGAPFVIVIILAVFFAVKSKRLETILEKKTHNDRNELGAVQDPSVSQVNESANDHYQLLDRNLDNSSGMVYDQLRVASETQYEEFSSNRT